MVWQPKLKLQKLNFIAKRHVAKSIIAKWKNKVLCETKISQIPAPKEFNSPFLTEMGKG